MRYGFRSGLEEKVGAQLAEAGFAGHYEDCTIPFLQPAKSRKYTVDFWIVNGILIETKGRFETADRQKHILVKEQHPDLDIRFVFSRSKSTISTKSKTTYADWCESNGFKYADKTIPPAWLREPINRRSLVAIGALLGKHA